MDVAIGFFAGSVVESTYMEAAIYNTDLFWFAKFWPPNLTQASKAFQNQNFESFLPLYDVSLRPVSSSRHCTTPIEPPHGTNRFIFLRLESANSNVSDSVLVF